MTERNSLNKKSNRVKFEMIEEDGTTSMVYDSKINFNHSEEEQARLYEQYLTTRKIEDMKKHWWVRLGKFLKVL